MNMEPMSALWSQAAHHFSEIQPMLGTYVHVLLSALFAIYTGSHASLTRPSSAAKPSKRQKQPGEEDGEEDPPESLQKMEGLSPIDAIMFPILAGCTLAGLYFVIKWLEDPALLNKILNWYFAVFGLLGVSKLFTDAMGLATSIVFPSKYSSDGQLWEVKSNQRIAYATEQQSSQRSSPLPGALSKIKLTPNVVSALWTLRELPSRRIHVRAYIHKLLAASVHVGPQGCLSFLLALLATFYFNTVAKPWWLTNVLGYSFAYAFLQLMSPSTFQTGSLVLAALFVYDIYFVFFTPLMVTVATQLDIPAKMLFPRPPSPKDDPAKQSLSMLGLGDIVLPGLVIGFALRFDLYLFYLRKQKFQDQNTSTESNDTTRDMETKVEKSPEIIKAEYRSATGGWGERLWVSRRNTAREAINGGVFPKTYFYACIRGYIVGMITTLGIMSIYGHAQPALLYLVPGVLGSLWITALAKGDLKTMWNYDETEPEGSLEKKPDEPRKTSKSIFSWSRQDDIAKQLEGHMKGDSEKEATCLDESKEAAEDSSKESDFFRDRKSELVFFSINLPNDPSSEQQPKPQEKTPGKKPKSKPSVEDELQMAFEGKMVDTPPSTRTRSMRKSMVNGEAEPSAKRVRRT